MPRPGTVPWWINRLIADSEPRRLAVAPAGLKCVLTRDRRPELENHDLVLYGGVRASIDVIEHWSTRPDSCGQGTVAISISRHVTAAP